jgi:hypothetical protein
MQNNQLVLLIELNILTLLIELITNMSCTNLISEPINN